MRVGRVAVCIAVVAVGLALGVALFSGAQEQPATVKTAEQQYKNIQVLKGMPVDQFNMSMHAISAELGVECGYCHVGHGNLFPLDDKPTKNTARKMMQMVMDINKNNFAGRNVVTCYTCHQGHPDPVGTINLPLPTFIETFDEPAPPTGPTADQILTRYIQALGGEQAIRKVTSRIITATMEIPSGPGGAVSVPSLAEQYRKAPNLELNINHTPTYTVADGFDGTTAWMEDMNGAVSDVPFVVDQARIKRGADFYESLNLRQQYARMVVLGVERVNDHEVYAVNGVPAGDSVERLYFDIRTGLLVRKTTILPTPFGNIPFQVDYENYRDTGSGVKYPFLIRMIPSSPRSEAQTSSTIRVQKVEDNVDIDNAKFAKPTSKTTK